MVRIEAPGRRASGRKPPGRKPPGRKHFQRPIAPVQFPRQHRRKPVEFEPVPPVKFGKRPPLLQRPQVPMQAPPPIRPEPRPAVPVTLAMLPSHTIDRASCEETFKTFRKRKALGSGSYGTVYELCDVNNVCPYVIKVQRPRNRQMLNHILDEVRVQIRVNEQLRFTPAIYDFWVCHPTNKTALAFIVMERIHGDMFDYLKRFPITDRFVRGFQRTLSDMVRQLHRIGITHRDIAARNIFYRQNQGGTTRWYLGDWGFAQPLNKQNEARDWHEVDDVLRYLKGFQLGWYRLPQKQIIAH